MLRRATRLSRASSPRHRRATPPARPRSHASGRRASRRAKANRQAAARSVIAPQSSGRAAPLPGRRTFRAAPASTGKMAMPTRHNVFLDGRPTARMLALIQRVTQAKVEVEGATVGAIGPGLLALVGVEPADGLPQIARMAERLLGYRVFADDAGRMNRSLTDIDGGLLLVSQFTLAADTASGMRPSFTTAAPPAEAERLFADL